MILPGPALKSIVSAAKAIGMWEVALRVEGATLTTIGCDPPQAIMMQTTIALAQPEAAPMNIYLLTESFAAAAKAFFKDEAVELSMVGSILTMASGRKKRSMPTVDPRNAEAPRIPPLTFTVKRTVPTKFLSDALAASNDIGAEWPVRISTTPTRFDFVRNPMGPNIYSDNLDGSVSDVGEATGDYGADLLSSAIDPCEHPEFELWMGARNYPLKIIYPIAGGEAVCLIAPRVQ